MIAGTTNSTWGLFIYRSENWLFYIFLSQIRLFAIILLCYDAYFSTIRHPINQFVDLFIARIGSESIRGKDNGEKEVFGN